MLSSPSVAVLLLFAVAVAPVLAEATRSRSRSVTATTSETRFSETLTQEQSSSSWISRSRSHSVTTTTSETRFSETLTQEQSSSSWISRSRSHSLTTTTSETRDSQSQTETQIPSLSWMSRSASFTNTESGTLPLSPSETLLWTPTASFGSVSRSYTSSNATVSDTRLLTPSATMHVTLTGGSDSASPTATETTYSLSKSAEISRTLVSHSLSATGVATETFSATDSLTTSRTGTDSPTMSRTISRPFYAPAIHGCWVPHEIFENVTFVITIRGQHLRATDRFALVKPSHECLDFPNSSYSNVLKVAVDAASDVLNPTIAFAQTNLPQGSYTLCYRPSVYLNLTCPHVINVKGMAPWMNTTLLDNVSRASGVTVDGVDPVRFNRLNCRRGAVLGDKLPAGYEAGPLVKWDSVNFVFGNASLPVEPAERCIFVVQPFNATPGYAGIDVTFDASLSATSDALLLFVPSADDILPAVIPAGSVPPLCPTALPGFTLHAAGTPGTFGQWRVRMPLVVVVACAGAKGDLGKFASLSFTTVETPCANDCTDSEGVRRGLCNYTSARCICNEGYAGDDCATATICSHSENSPRVSGGKALVSRSGTHPCGVLVSSDGTNLGRAGPFGIASKASKLRLSSSNCSLAYVIFREGSYNGREALRLCEKDMPLVATKTAPLYASTLATFYVEFRGAAADDYFELLFASMSLTCPGETDSSGWVTPARVCHRRGRCQPLDLNLTLDVPDSAFGCLCDLPFAPPVPWGSCDACGFGYMTPTYPLCAAVPRCPQDCNRRGECTQRGCVCRPPYYGPMCESIGGQRVAASAALLSRFALDDGSGGDTENGASFLSCQVSGCKKDARETGISYYTPTTGDATYSSQLRSFSTLSDETALLPPRDVGLSLNSVPLPGSIGDYMLLQNVSGTPRDVTSRFSIATWVRLTANSSGFLYAKLDFAFGSDGRSPVLDRAVFDVQDRRTPLDGLLLRHTPLSLYFGVFVNGPMERIDIISVDVRRRTAARRKEDWFYVRHFFLDSNTRSKLFDGSWRFVTISVTRALSRLQAQIYVDGFTIDANVNFVQCLPFVPSKVDVRDVNATGAASAFDPGVSVLSSHGAVVLGYALVGALDEFRIYSPTIGPLSIVAIAGPEFLKNISITPPVLIAGIVVSACCGFLAGIIFLRRKKPLTEQAKAEKDDATEPVKNESDNNCGNSADEKEIEQNSPARNPLESSPTFQAVTPVEQPTSSGKDCDEEKSEDDNEQEVDCEMEKDFNRKVEYSKSLTAVEPADMATQSNKAAAREIHKKHKTRKTVVTVVAATAQLQQTSGDVVTTTNSRQQLGNSHSESVAAVLQCTSLCQFTWQVMALNIGSFQWPISFSEVVGVATAAIALCFDVGFNVSFGISFYITTGVALAAFLVVLVYVILEAAKSEETRAQDRAERLQRRRESLRRGLGGAVERSREEWVVWTAIVTLATVYLPATRNSIVGVFCYYTIQCEYFCYNEAAHWSIVYTGVANLALVTLCAPIMFARLTLQKRREFLQHYASFEESADDDDLKREIAVSSSVLQLRDAQWIIFLRHDHSPFAGIYDGFQWSFGYFQACSMIAKAVICFATLSTNANTDSQVVAVTVIHGFFALAVCFVRPYILDVCNAVVCIGQVFIIVMLSVNCYFRLEAENRDELLGYILTGMAAAFLVLQISVVIYFFKRAVPGGDIGECANSKESVTQELAA